MVARGWDPSITLSASRLGAYDFFVEITIDTNQIVWEWNPWDHLIQSKNPAWPNYIDDVKNAPGRFDIYWLTDNQQPAISGTAGPVNDWWHVNSIDYDDDTGHMVVNPKHWSDFFVIDHDKTFVSATDWAANKAAAAGPAGDLLYRWGNPSSYNSGVAPGWMTEGDSQMYGSHDIQFIHPYFWKIPRLATDKWPDPRYYTKSGVSLPGAGNFLIFDNGCYNPNGMKSRVLEINGRIGASGNVEAALGKYIWQPTAGYKTTNTEVSPEQTVGLELCVPDAAQLLQQPYLERPASAQRQYPCRCRKPGPFLRGDAGGPGGVGIPLSRHSGHDCVTDGRWIFQDQYRQHGRHQQFPMLPVLSLRDGFPGSCRQRPVAEGNLERPGPETRRIV